MKKEKLICETKITTHWWNLGRKTLEFTGTISDLLKKWNFKVSEIDHPKQGTDLKGYRFKVEISSITTTMDIFGNSFETACITALRNFYFTLGDKVIISTRYGSQFKINFNK